MGLKRRNLVFWSCLVSPSMFLRMLLLPSLFLAIAGCVLSVVISAPIAFINFPAYSLPPCAESCGTFELFPFKSGGRADRFRPGASDAAQAGFSPAGTDVERRGAGSRSSENKALSAASTAVSGFRPQGPSQGGENGSSVLSKEEILAGVMELMEQLRISGDWMSSERSSDACEGRYVYVYNLPTKFNADLVGNCGSIMPWSNLCEFFSNSGMGKVRYDPALIPPGRWFQTLQYSLEVLSHAKILRYQCLTLNPASASLFYIPFYAGLDVLHWNFAPNASTVQRDQLSLELVRWLETQQWWHRKGGRDHVLVLGKITWDFRRVDNRSSSWGNYLLKLPHMQNLTKLLIERDPWHPNDVGVPHPTYFHPSSDEDIRLWQQRALESPRGSLVSFAGMPRPGDPDNIRTRLIQQCLEKNNDSLCRVLKCHQHVCLNPEVTMKLFLRSQFCMQPGGDSPTRRSIFDSLIAGCIPVLFDPYSAYTQYPWHLPRDSSSYSVYIPQEDVRKGVVDVVTILQQLPQSHVQRMRNTILLQIMPRLLYAQPGAKLSSFRDAFDVSLSNMFNRLAQREAKGEL